MFQKRGRDTPDPLFFGPLLLFPLCPPRSLRLNTLPSAICKKVNAESAEKAVSDATEEAKGQAEPGRFATFPRYPWERTGRRLVSPRLERLAYFSRCCYITTCEYSHIAVRYGVRGHAGVNEAIQGGGLPGPRAPDPSRHRRVPRPGRTVRWPALREGRSRTGECLPAPGHPPQ